MSCLRTVHMSGFTVVQCRLCRTLFKCFVIGCYYRKRCLGVEHVSCVNPSRGSQAQTYENLDRVEQLACSSKRMLRWPVTRTVAGKKKKPHAVVPVSIYPPRLRNRRTIEGRELDGNWQWVYSEKMRQILISLVKLNVSEHAVLCKLT